MPCTPLSLTAWAVATAFRPGAQRHATPCRVAPAAHGVRSSGRPLETGHCRKERGNGGREIKEAKGGGLFITCNHAGVDGVSVEEEVLLPVPRRSGRACPDRTTAKAPRSEAAAQAPWRYCHRNCSKLHPGTGGRKAPNKRFTSAMLLRKTRSVVVKVGDMRRHDSKLALVSQSPSGAESSDSELPKLGEVGSTAGDLSTPSTPAIDVGSPAGRSRASKQV